MRTTVKRLWMGSNAVAAVVLAGALTVAINVLARHYGWRADVSRERHYTLSARTCDLLAGLTDDVRIVALLGAEHDLYRDLRHLLREYARASPRVRVEFVDPRRDLARTKELALRYDLSEPETLVVAAGDRAKRVALRELADYDLAPLLAGRAKRMTAFRGEQAVSSALQRLLQARKPMVYFTTGHGERRLDLYDQYAGYSMWARALQRDQIEVRTLALEQSAGVPADADAVVIAGPTRRWVKAELDLLRAYLARSGRVCVLVDAGVETGLDAWLEEWGVRLAPDRVVGLTLTGRELLVRAYGAHPIAAALPPVTTLFNGPRSVQPLAADTAADKPRVTVLAACGDEGWAEMTPAQHPPVFDAGVDRRGPVPVAVAVEKGPLDAMEVQLQPTRLVVVGDSSWLANGALLAGYNTDLAVSAMNWLLEREPGLAIAARAPAAFRVVLGAPQRRLLGLMLTAVLPGAAVLLGVIVRLRRRR